MPPPGASAAAIVTAGIAGLVAGALSMAAGEYVSVSSQRDAEQADIRLEERELRSDPQGELRELAGLYEARGLPPALAGEVAVTLSRRGALQAHLRDELGLDQRRLARPFQAAWASALSFSTGAALPLLAVALAPASGAIVVTVVVTLVALGGLGDLGARLGGAPRGRARSASSSGGPSRWRSPRPSAPSSAPPSDAPSASHRRAGGDPRRRCGGMRTPRRRATDAKPSPTRIARRCRRCRLAASIDRRKGNWS